MGNMNTQKQPHYVYTGRLTLISIESFCSYQTQTSIKKCDTIRINSKFYYTHFEGRKKQNWSKESLKYLKQLYKDSDHIKMQFLCV